MTFLKKVLRSRVFIGGGCLALGIAGTLLIQDSLKVSRQVHDPIGDVFNQKIGIDSTFDSFFDDNFFRSRNAPFEDMGRIRKKMMKRFESFDDDSGAGIFDSWFKKKFGGGGPGDIQTREDDKNIYYDVFIEGLKKDKLNIEVKNGQITVSGLMEKKFGKEEDNNHGLFKSTFHRSFPIPPDVDEKRVKIAKNEDKITLTFPKIL